MNLASIKLINLMQGITHTHFISYDCIDIDKHFEGGKWITKMAYSIQGIEFKNGKTDHPLHDMKMHLGTRKMGLTTQMIK